MSKETERMRQIRVNRIGIREVLIMAEQMSNSHRHTIAENWDKENDKECRKSLYKAHRGLAKSRAIVRECQKQLRESKRELRKLNRQHDIRNNAVTNYILHNTHKDDYITE